MVSIHPQAIVHRRADLAKDVEVGPYSIIGENVVIGEGTKVGPHVIIEGWTIIGKNNHIYPGVIMGTEPQDKKFKGEKSFLIIGDNNIIREYATINRASGEEEKTKIGNNNMIMANVHIAHNCSIGNETALANLVALSGYVTIEDQVVLSGFAGMHQFIRVGELAMVGAFAKVGQDVLPYALVDGSPAKVYGLNRVGIKRANIPLQEEKELKRAFNLIYRSGLNLSQAKLKISEELNQSKRIQHLLGFLEKSERGICGFVREKTVATNEQG